MMSQFNDPPTRATTDKVAVFDLDATLVHHVTGRPVAMMGRLLGSLATEGWTIRIASGSTEVQSHALLVKMLDQAHQTMPEGTPLSVSNIERVPVSRDAILPPRDLFKPAPRIVFVTADPTRIEDALSLNEPLLSVVGFIGSRKNCPRIAASCAARCVWLALSAVDLGAMMAEGHVPIPWELPSLDDAIDVVPGLHLPWNVFGGDHRHPVRQVLQRQQRLSPEQLNRFWSNLIWIRDEQSVLGTLEQTAMIAAKVAPWSADAEEVIAKLDASGRRQVHHCKRLVLAEMERGAKRLGGDEVLNSRPHLLDFKDSSGVPIKSIDQRLSRIRESTAETR